MDKLVSVGFKFSPTIIFALRSTAIDTFAIFPSVLDALVNDISLRFVFGELICRKLAVWELAATLRRDSKLVSSVMAMPNNCFENICSMRFSRSGICSSSPLINRLAFHAEKLHSCNKGRGKWYRSSRTIPAGAYQ